jgi:hypothetical protein
MGSAIPNSSNPSSTLSPYRHFSSSGISSEGILYGSIIVCLKPFEFVIEASLELLSYQSLFIT